MIEPCVAPVEINEGDLVAYIDGEAALEATAHIARCPACRAEIESLRQMSALFSQALQSAPAAAASAGRRPVSDRLKSGDVLETLPVWSARLNQSRRGPSPPGLKFRRKISRTPKRPVWRFALAGAALGLILAALIAVYEAPLISPQSVALSPPVEESVAPAVVREAAAPDVNQAVLARYDLEETPVIAEIQTTPGHETPPSETKTHPMIRRRIIDVSVGAQIIIEENFAIVPPLDLRRALARESGAAKASLLIHAKPAADYRVESSIVDEKGNRYLVWADNDHGLTALYFSHSTGAGRTWGREVKIDDGVGRVFNPHLAIDKQGRLYVVWQNWRTIDRHDFYFARSTDGGQTWSDVIRVDDTTGKTFNPSLAINADGELSLTWQNRSRANTGIYFTRSTDGGQTWSDKVRAANIGS